MYAFLIQAGLAIILLEYVNYMQHYGLRREVERDTQNYILGSTEVLVKMDFTRTSTSPAHHLKLVQCGIYKHTRILHNYRVVTTSVFGWQFSSAMEESNGKRIEQLSA